VWRHIWGVVGSLVIVTVKTSLKIGQFWPSYKAYKMCQFFFGHPCSDVCVRHVEVRVIDLMSSSLHRHRRDLPMRHLRLRLQGRVLWRADMMSFTLVVLLSYCVVRLRNGSIYVVHDCKCTQCWCVSFYFTKFCRIVVHLRFRPGYVWLAVIMVMALDLRLI